MTIPQHHPVPQDIIPGNDPPCPDWCEDRATCETCGGAVCAEHEPDAVTTCAGGGVHHADECDRQCNDCDAAAKWDAASEYADALRSGELDD